MIQFHGFSAHWHVRTCTPAANHMLFLTLQTMQREKSRQLIREQKARNITDMDRHVMQAYKVSSKPTVPFLDPGSAIVRAQCVEAGTDTDCVRAWAGARKRGPKEAAEHAARTE